MSPAKKRTTKGARKTAKKATRKTTAKKATGKTAAKKATKAKAKPRKKATSSAAKSAPAKKTAPRKAATKKTAKRDAGESPAKKAPAKKGPAAKPAKTSGKPAAKRRVSSARRADKRRKGQPKQRVAQPLESAERKPELGAKWACFSCGAKFYDLNRPDPICPKCQTDQREQPAKSADAPPKPPAKRPAAAPISRLLDEEEAAEPAFEEDAESDDAAELDIGKLDNQGGYLNNDRFNDDSEA